MVATKIRKLFDENFVEFHLKFLFFVFSLSQFEILNNFKILSTNQKKKLKFWGVKHSMYVCVFLKCF